MLLEENDCSVRSTFASDAISANLTLFSKIRVAKVLFLYPLLSFDDVDTSTLWFMFLKGNCLQFQFFAVHRTSTLQGKLNYPPLSPFILIQDYRQVPRYFSKWIQWRQKLQVKRLWSPLWTNLRGSRKCKIMKNHYFNVYTVWISWFYIHIFNISHIPFLLCDHTYISLSLKKLFKVILGTVFFCFSIVLKTSVSNESKMHKCRLSIFW